MSSGYDPLLVPLLVLHTLALPAFGHLEIFHPGRLISERICGASKPVKETISIS